MREWQQGADSGKDFSNHNTRLGLSICFLVKESTIEGIYNVACRSCCAKLALLV